MLWMRDAGVRFMPIWGRCQGLPRVDGRFKFWGGLTVEAWSGGPEQSRRCMRRRSARGVGHRVWRASDRAVRRRRRRGGRLCPPRRAHPPRSPPRRWCWRAAAPSNAEWRTRYLGPSGISQGARHPVQHRRRHSAGLERRRQGQQLVGPSGTRLAWDRNAPEFGDLGVGDGFQKHSYPLGVMLNARGERFVDEGADFRNYTYAKYGRVILEQPHQFAWQVFDAKVTPLLRDGTDPRATLVLR